MMKTQGYLKPTHFTFINRLKHIRFWSLFLLIFVFGLTHAQTTLTEWNFSSGNLLPSTGAGTASIYGSLSQSFPTSSYGKCWQLSNFPNQSSQNGTRGVGFNVSTVGYTNVQVNFEQRASGSASRWAQVDYSIDGGSNWILAYWNNNGAIIPKDSWVAFSVDFTNVAGVANNANFKVRIVSVFCPLAFDESTNTTPFLANSAYMITESSAVYLPNTSSNNNTYSSNGSWRFDNVSIKGYSIPVLNAQVLTSAMTAEYGTNSNVIPITISATNLISSIYATPAIGFELSTNSTSGFSPAPLTGLTNGSFIYVRTVSNKTAGTFNSTPCFILQSNGALTKNVTTKSSGNQITQKVLQITADDEYKEMGLALVSAVGYTNFTSSGLISGESISSISVLYGLAGASSGIGAIIGTYPNQVIPSLPIGATFTSTNYAISYVNGTIYVTGFTPGNIIANRIGDGITVLGTITFPLNLQEFLPTGVQVQTMNQQFSNANLLTETGELVTSTGHLNSLNAYIGIPGYNAAPGSGNTTISQPKATNILGLGASVNGRIVFSANGGVLPFEEGHLSSLLPMNATTFYAAGSGINNSGGIWFYNGSNFIQLNGDFNATRNVEEYNDNLYFSTDVSPAGIYQLGNGLPMTSGQIATLILSTTSPRGFSFSPDGNTVFVTDDSPLNGNNGGGIQKWIKQNGIWTKAYTHLYRVKGLTVDFSDSIAQIYATTFLNSPGFDNNKILKIIDSDSLAVPIDLAVAGTNYIFKGLDFAPALPPSAPQIAQVEQPTCTQSTGKIHFTGLPAGQWRITGNPSGSKTGTGATAVLENLSPGQSYSFKVTSFTGRNSIWSSTETIQAQPEIPTMPTGSAMQKRCQGSTLGELNLNQSNVLWYESTNSITPLNSSSPLIHNNHYYAAQLNINGCQSIGRCDVVAKLVNNGEWKGEDSGSWKNQSNWCGGVPLLGASVSIPELTTIHLDTLAELTGLNIQNTGVLHISDSKKLTISGDLIMNGELRLHDKCTIVQNENSTWSGNGNVFLQQAITGTGGTTASGRLWFVGSPMGNSLSQDYKAETSAVLKYFNEPTGSWIEINNSNTPIEIGKGYFVQTGVMDTLVFSGGNLNNGNYTIPCTRTGSTNSYRGFNLISNPYASYVDFDAVTKTNILPTMWYRTADLTQAMVFDTYNSELGIGTSLGGETVTQFIPPMQSFWVKIPTGFTTGAVGFSNAMRSHYSIGFEGLKSGLNDFPVYVRLNLLDQDKKDQLIVYMDHHVSSDFDQKDSEKMIVAGYPQLYATVGPTKLVIDGLPFTHEHTTVPLTLNIPTAKTYVFKAEEITHDQSGIVLEDKLLGVFQDLTEDPSYTFYSVNGIISNRFVLHFNFSNGNNGTLMTSERTNEEDAVFVFSTSNDGIHVSINEALNAPFEIEVIDAMGRLVKTVLITDQESVIGLQAGSGFYFLQFNLKNEIVRKKVLLNN